jgi:acyl-CoA reductase-like NAD-dependent aldehyde dehydrogenase
MWFLIVLSLFCLWFFVRYIWSDYTAPAFLAAKVPDVRSFTGRALPIVAPGTGKVVETVNVATEEEVKDVVKKARVAQQKWKDTSFAERRSVLMDIMQYVIDHATEIAEISIVESGKVRLEAVSGELLPTCEKIRYICSAGEAALKEESRSVPALLFLKKACVRYFPLGVIGCIVPGNFPFHNAVSHITTAIFSGNAAVVKVNTFEREEERKNQN